MIKSETFARKFFEKRFDRSPTSDPGYFKEWKHRLETYSEDHLYRVMDKRSWDVYQELKSKYTVR